MGKIFVEILGYKFSMVWDSISVLFSFGVLVV
jgi:hypothetical protein